MVWPAQNRIQPQTQTPQPGQTQQFDPKLLQDIKGLLEQLLAGKGGQQAQGAQGGGGKGGGVDPSQMDPDQLEKLMEKLRDAMQSQLPANATPQQQSDALNNLLAQLPPEQAAALRQILGSSGIQKPAGSPAQGGPPAIGGAGANFRGR